MTTTNWPEFHIAILSNDSTLFPSFPSKELSGGDVDKILLSDIREHAAISQKLKFTADGKTILNDNTAFSYYMSLRADKSDGLNGEKDKKVSDDAGTKPATDIVAAKQDEEKQNNAIDTDMQQKRVVKTIQVDLILNSAGGSGGDAKRPTVSIEPAKIQEGIDKMIMSMKSDGAVKLGDLKKLSDSLGALKTDSMNFAAVASPVTYPEPLDLTELQWEAVFRNNRALHGWVYKDNMIVKARKQAFQLIPTLDAGRGDQAKVTAALKTGGKEKTPTPAIGILPPVPPFYVWDDASVEVTEMANALEQTMANQGFSSTAIKAAGGGGAMGAQATGSLAVETEHSTASKQLDTEKVHIIHVAYKFPRAAVEVDAYCLELTEECKRQALECRERADVDRWQREYGSVFATQFTLGGELTSSRLFQAVDKVSLSAFKDSVKIAAGASISTPYGSAGASYGSFNSNETDKGNSTAQQSMRLAWQARGGDTLLCSNPPAWTSTVKDYRLWRIMDQQGMVKMIDLVKTINLKAGSFLENPVTASKRESSSGMNDDKVWALISTALKEPQNHPVAAQIKGIYESKGFSLEDFNASLKQDETDFRLSERTSWPDLKTEQKVLIGMLCYNKKLLSLD